MSHIYIYIPLYVIHIHSIIRIHLYICIYISLYNVNGSYLYMTHFTNFKADSGGLPRLGGLWLDWPSPPIEGKKCKDKAR